MAKKKKEVKKSDQEQTEMLFIEKLIRIIEISNNLSEVVESGVREMGREFPEQVNYPYEGHPMYPTWKRCMGLVELLCRVTTIPSLESEEELRKWCENQDSNSDVFFSDWKEEISDEEDIE
jgi:hypothetical protein